MHVRIVAVLAALSASPSLAAECRVTSSVKASTASDQANRDAGGHVGLHMKNAKSPLPKGGASSQLGKTAFKDWATFQAAYNTWASGTVTTGVTAGPRKCGTSSSEKDCVLASKLGITEAWTCTAVDGNGICTEWKPVTGTLYVGFWYANNSSTGGKWNMNTAYPSADSQCN